MMLRVAKQLASIKDGQLVLNQETLEWVRESFPQGTQWVVVFGVARGGKSTLCKLLSNTQFVVSKKSEACTYGVWISEPVLMPDGRSLVVVDSEGTELGDTTYQHKILAFACLLACNGGVLIHNDLHYANDAMATLAKLTSAMKLLRGLEKENWPALCFRVRDFEAEVQVNGVDATPDELFAHLLQSKGDSHDINRQLITSCFETRKMFGTPPFLKKDRDFLADHHKLQEGEFKTAIDEMQQWVFSAVQEKKIGGVECDGATIAIFLDFCTKCINEGGHVEIPSVLEATMDVLCSKRADEALNSYKTTMRQFFEALTDEILLQTAHEEESTLAISEYTKETEGFYQKSVNRLLEYLKTSINQEYVAINLQWHKLARQEAERITREEQLKREEAEKRFQEEREEAEKRLKLEREISEKRFQEERLAREALEQKLAEANQPCKHENNNKRQESIITNRGHHGKWGGFLYGHRCCGKCLGHLNGKCNNSCGGICGNPKIDRTRTTLTCTQCGYERVEA